MTRASDGFVYTATAAFPCGYSGLVGRLIAHGHDGRSALLRTHRLAHVRALGGTVGGVHAGAVELPDLDSRHVSLPSIRRRAAIWCECSTRAARGCRRRVTRVAASLSPHSPIHSHGLHIRGARPDADGCRTDGCSTSARAAIFLSRRRRRLNNILPTSDGTLGANARRPPAHPAHRFPRLKGHAHEGRAPGSRSSPSSSRRT